MTVDVLEAIDRATRPAQQDHDPVLRRLREAEERTRETIAKGRLADHSEYRYQCGRLAGLREAARLIEQAGRDRP